MRAVLTPEDQEPKPRKPTQAERGTAGNKQLNARHHRFIQEYIRTLNAAQSARAAGYKYEVEANRLLRNPLVKELIDKGLADKAARNAISADEALVYHFKHSRTELPLLARNGACRFCYGMDFQYQFTQAEYREAQQKHFQLMQSRAARNRVPFDERGGMGFDPYKPPVDDCPECWGHGKDYPMLAHEIEAILTPEQRTLFDGVTFDKRSGSVRFEFQNRMEHAKMAYTLAALIRPVKAIEKLNPAEMTDDQLEEAVRNAREQGLLGEASSQPSTVQREPGGPGPVIDAEPFETVETESTEVP